TMTAFTNALRATYSDKATSLMVSALSTAEKELKALNKDYNDQGYLFDPTKGPGLDKAQVKETRDRLTALLGQANLGPTDRLSSKSIKNADRLVGILDQHKDDPMVKMMGPTKFLGYLLAVEEKIANGSPQVKNAAANMSTLEKVALYGYTCADYVL